MKLLIAFLFHGLLLVPSLRAVPELTGIFVMGDEARFVLVDPSDGESSGSLVIGNEFAGYKLLNYDRERDVLILSREGIEHRLRLREARIEDASVVFTGTIRLGVDGQMREARLRLLNGQERAFAVTPEMTLFLTAENRSDGTVVYTGRFEKQLPDGTTEIARAPSVITRSGSSFAVSAGELEFKLDPEP